MIDTQSLRRQAPLFSSSIAGVFNQDWDLDYPSIEEAYAEAFDAGDAPARRAMLKEIEMLLRSCRTDAEASAFMDAAGSALNTEGATGLRPRMWLEMIQGRIAGGLPPGDVPDGH